MTLSDANADYAKRMSVENTVIPFGKYARQTLGDIPASYIQWLSGQANLFDDLREAIDQYTSTEHFRRRLVWRSSHRTL